MADSGRCADCLHESTTPIEVTASAGTHEQSGSSQQDNVLDSKTFVAPVHPIPRSITIEFCNRCRWLHRASWTSTELMLTFPPPTIQSISLIPLDSEETGGRFRVWLYMPAENGGFLVPKLVWDRKIEGGFPELKVLKQRIRDHTDPGKNLGHSDKNAANG